MKYDFAGWATRANLKCSDGRTIMPNAFSDNDGHTVPLVWNHRHDDSFNVLGHALLKNKEEGVYAYCTFNDTEQGRNAKELVEHGDIDSLSIFANRLQQKGGNVYHGDIKEVSLVLAGANPGAHIESVLRHSDDGSSYESQDEIDIYTGEPIELAHADEEVLNNTDNSEEIKMADGAERTIGDVIETMNEEQKKVLYALVGQALEDDGSEDEEADDVKHNVFDNNDETMNGSDFLSHADQLEIISDAKRYGSLKESALQHGMDDIIMHDDDPVVYRTYGVGKTDEELGWLFPEARSLNNPPSFISREMDWVKQLMGAVHHTPFSRIKSMFANITEDEARAKGYMKGKRKKEEVFGLLKRTTTPQTIYKKQKLDRDDVIDITDFDIVAWLKGEMRMMLDEEIARAILIGDGRTPSDDDKIDETHIRPIATDDDLYTIKVKVTPGEDADETQLIKDVIRSILLARIDYKGSGNPTMYTTEEALTKLLLLDDEIGRPLYETVDKLATKLRVSKIVTVPVMEDAVDKQGNPIIAIIVNPVDYNVGADKGGSIALFDDFDIDLNQMKYLIETRCSGALTKPYSAIAVSIADD